MHFCFCYDSCNEKNHYDDDIMPEKKCKSQMMHQKKKLFFNQNYNHNGLIIEITMMMMINNNQMVTVSIIIEIQQQQWLNDIDNRYKNLLTDLLQIFSCVDWIDKLHFYPIGWRKKNGRKLMIQSRYDFIHSHIVVDQWWKFKMYENQWNTNVEWTLITSPPPHTHTQ